MNITFDREERRKQREFLRGLYPDYDAKRHDSFVMRYNKALEDEAFQEYLRRRKVAGVNPVTTRRLPSGKYRVRSPGGVKAFATTREKAEAQSRLLRGVEHGMVPRARNPSLQSIAGSRSPFEMRGRTRYLIVPTKTGYEIYTGARQAAPHKVRSYPALIRFIEKKEGRRIIRGNPPEVPIYHDIVAMVASKKGMPHNCDAACKRADHTYIHYFKKGAGVFGEDDGSINVRKRN